MARGEQRDAPALSNHVRREIMVEHLPVDIGRGEHDGPYAVRKVGVGRLQVTQPVDRETRAHAVRHQNHFAFRHLAHEIDEHIVEIGLRPTGIFLVPGIFRHGMLGGPDKGDHGPVKTRGGGDLVGGRQRGGGAVVIAMDIEKDAPGRRLQRLAQPVVPRIFRGEGQHWGLLCAVRGETVADRFDRLLVQVMKRAAPCRQRHEIVARAIGVSEGDEIDRIPGGRRRLHLRGAAGARHSVGWWNTEAARQRQGGDHRDQGPYSLCHG